jgi:hypothetical protein
VENIAGNECRREHENVLRIATIREQFQGCGEIWPSYSESQTETGNARRNGGEWGIRTPDTGFARITV